MDENQNQAKPKKTFTTKAIALTALIASVLTFTVTILWISYVNLVNDREVQAKNDLNPDVATWETTVTDYDNELTKEQFNYIVDVYLPKISRDFQFNSIDLSYSEEDYAIMLNIEADRESFGKVTAEYFRDVPITVTKEDFINNITEPFINAQTEARNDLGERVHVEVSTEDTDGKVIMRMYGSELFSFYLNDID